MGVTTWNPLRKKFMNGHVEFLIYIYFTFVSYCCIYVTKGFDYL
jgi:hypothetical protein